MLVLDDSTISSVFILHLACDPEEQWGSLQPVVELIMCDYLCSLLCKKPSPGDVMQWEEISLFNWGHCLSFLCWWDSPCSHGLQNWVPPALRHLLDFLDCSLPFRHTTRVSCLHRCSEQSEGRNHYHTTPGIFEVENCRSNSSETKMVWKGGKNPINFVCFGFFQLSISKTLS